VGLTAEQECPQCGAPVELEETDHLLLCPYCNVNSFLSAPDYFRFVLPHKAPNRDLIYVPYLRFRGSVYFCSERTTGHRIVDITHLGVPFKKFPISLGLRPQAVKMRFVTPDTDGAFLKCFLTTAELLKRAAKHATVSVKGKIFHRTFIGEALSLIFLPLYVEAGTVFDAITNKAIARLPKDDEIFARLSQARRSWKLTPLATVCPQCGWNLEGERDSVVLTCGNCQTAWGFSRGRFVRVDLAMMSTQETDVTYLPFWKMSIRATGVELDSYADFIRLTNQPRAIRRQWENQEMSFWSPAFKIRPKLFLSLLRQLNVSQLHPVLDEGIPKERTYPVTLPLSEANQTLKLAIAGSTMNKKKVFPLLPRMNIRTTGATLVYLPFSRTGHEMVQKDMGVSIFRKTLEFGRYL